MKSSLLCVILDRRVLQRKLIEVADKALIAGADMIQFRDKDSSTEDVLKAGSALIKLTRKYNVPLIINDRVDIATAIDSDGVHIGQGDMDIKTVRKIVGSGKLIGLSVSTMKQARIAKAEGADYLGIGPIFATPIKASISAMGLTFIKNARLLGIPIIAIGGIGINNIAMLTRNGFKRVAVIRAVCAASNAFISTKRLKEALI